jgi:hypothetical protein
VPQLYFHSPVYLHGHDTLLSNFQLCFIRGVSIIIYNLMKSGCLFLYVIYSYTRVCINSVTTVLFDFWYTVLSIGTFIQGFVWIVFQPEVETLISRAHELVIGHKM